MKFSEVAKRVADVAPLLGTAMAGPAGGALGAVVARVFGTINDPSEIEKAIARDPEAAFKLRQIELAHEEKLRELVMQGESIKMQEESKRIQAVNTTMQSEYQHADTWYQKGWRPFIGFITGFSFLGVVIAVGLLAYEAIASGKPEAMNLIPLLIGAFSTLFAIPGAILGVSAWHRGEEKRERAHNVGEAMKEYR